MKRILITGVAGFIGSNLAERLLHEDHSVVGIDNLAYGIETQVPKGVHFFRGDIRSKDIYPLFKDIDVVFHFAAKNCISDCQKDPVETADINIVGTVNVFDAAARAGVKKVIYAESSAMYEGSLIFPTPETEAKPESFYARSKLSAMHFAKAYQKFYGLTTVGLRYFSVYGPRQDYRRTIPPLPSAFIIKLLKGESPVIYGTGEKRRDYIYIDDINDFHVLAMNDNRVNNQVFNLGFGANYSVKEIYKLVGDALGIHIDPEFKADLPGEAQITLADISKAKSVGWQPRVPLTEGVKRSVEYIKQKVVPKI